MPRSPVRETVRDGDGVTDVHYGRARSCSARRPTLTSSMTCKRTWTRPRSAVTLTLTGSSSCIWATPSGTSSTDTGCLRADLQRKPC
jgi:hypothetical protein